ncbi:hypothetical protein DFP72DRAFT_1066730 [Ephemerocybe angulata]|uniref:Uncharacterized protein n=1 Tax=Ephemerocybe angulata TaxID=980116 RepID=A0A8H6I1M5_9AGAR|nr:hypothetical protein DFP72DRAFT_1066730 [Tulosesus angulatus]
MARVDPDYISSTNASDQLSERYTGPPEWRIGGCLPSHLEFFKQCCQTHHFFNPQMHWCLFAEQNPSPLPAPHGEHLELFCSCTTCHRVLLGKTSPEETRIWREARDRWRRRKDECAREVERENGTAATSMVQLEALRARKVVAAALDLTEKEVSYWEREAGPNWKRREKEKEKASAREESLSDVGGSDEFDSDT